MSRWLPPQKKMVQQLFPFTKRLKRYRIWDALAIPFQETSTYSTGSFHLDFSGENKVLLIQRGVLKQRIKDNGQYVNQINSIDVHRAKATYLHTPNTHTHTRSKIDWHFLFFLSGLIMGDNAGTVSQIMINLLIKDRQRSNWGIRVK